MRRPGYLGDLEDFWFAGFGLITDSDAEIEPWLRNRSSSSSSAADKYLDEKRALTRRSKEQGWLTTGPIKQHHQRYVGSGSRSLSFESNKY